MTLYDVLDEIRIFEGKRISHARRIIIGIDVLCDIRKEEKATVSLSFGSDSKPDQIFGIPLLVDYKNKTRFSIE